MVLDGISFLRGGLGSLYVEALNALLNAQGDVTKGGTSRHHMTDSIPLLITLAKSIQASSLRTNYVSGTPHEGAHKWEASATDAKIFCVKRKPLKLAQFLSQFLCLGFCYRRWSVSTINEVLGQLSAYLHISSPQLHTKITTIGIQFPAIILS